MLGQLQDADNSTTLDHYLRLLETAFLASELERFSPGQARSRGLAEFLRKHPRAVPLIVGGDGFELTEFFARDPAELLPALG
jgi:hypothetical protein